MPNPRITAKERGLLKGAIRRVFSRSELRREVLEAGVVAHSDPKRKRVKTWVKCAECGGLDAKSNVQVDHLQPVVPVTTTLEAMTWDELVDRIWCDKKNLQILCEVCHNVKSVKENAVRRANRKAKK